MVPGKEIAKDGTLTHFLMDSYTHTILKYHRPPLTKDSLMKNTSVTSIEKPIDSQQVLV